MPHPFESLTLELDRSEGGRSFPWMKFLLTSTMEDGFRTLSPAQFIFKHGETDMGDKGKKDKGKREQQKKAQLTAKEKRKLKREKKK